jgi:hypothetical protein
MSKRLLPFLLLLTAFTVLYSCKKDNGNDGYYTEPTRGYFPLQLGRYIIYDVDSTIWTDFNCTKKTSHMQMRYTVSDTFTDFAGRPSFTVDVHQRASVSGNDTGLWQVSQVFYVTPTTSGIDVVMNNLRMEKLIFPVTDNGTWIGNRNIDTSVTDFKFYGNWIYKYSSLLQPYNNGRATFQNTVTVDAVDQKTGDPDSAPNAYGDRTYMREVYGYDVGLIYRELTRWVYDPATAGTATCRIGYSVTMRAVDHN